MGDIVSAVGRPRDEVETTLKSLLETHQGHLEVSDSGELVYLFDRRLILRDRVPLFRRIVDGTKRALAAGFKAWIVTMLVVYFAVMVALVIAAIAAMMSRGGNRRGGGGLGRGRRGGFRLPNFWLWYYLWTPRWRLGRPYYGRRWEATLDKDERPPFYKKVFAFVFGPDRPKPTQAQLDRSVIRLIRARKGVLTATELVEHTALPLPAAEEEMARLLGAYAGEPAVSAGGELVYGFPELMVSARGPVRAKEPNPASMRLEYPLELTGNEKKHDRVIMGMNGFTLVAAATAPWFIFPQLGLGGPLAMIGLVIVPVVFSALFFSIPLLRMRGVRKENRARRTRNLRRLAVALVYRRALEGDGQVTVAQVTTHVRRHLKGDQVTPEEVEAVVHQLAAEFDADVHAGADGGLIFGFTGIRDRFVASESVRRQLQLQDRPLGEVVYSTTDTAEEESVRDGAAWDRALAAEKVDLGRYLKSTDRSAFEDEFELVAIEESVERKTRRRS